MGPKIKKKLLNKKIIAVILAVSIFGGAILGGILIPKHANAETTTTSLAALTTEENQLIYVITEAKVKDSDGDVLTSADLTNLMTVWDLGMSDLSGSHVQTKSSSYTKTNLLQDILNHKVTIDGGDVLLANSLVENAGLNAYTYVRPDGTTAVITTSDGGASQTAEINTTKDTEDVGECSLVPMNLMGCIYEGLAWIVNLMIELFGKVLAICAWIFRIAIKFSIIEFKTLVDNPGTRAAWQALRDISNMFFIFILLYAAIGTILQIHKIDAKKIVLNVVVVAILINFSFLISTVIIDVGNQLALFFYDRITNNGAEPIDVTFVTALKLSESTNLTGGKVKNNDLTQNSDADFKGVKPTGLTVKGIIIKGIGAIIIILITAFLLAAAAYMFLARAVTLALLTVVSPLAFLLMAFPSGVGSVGKAASAWWNKLIKQTLFAPAYLILIYAVTVIVKGGGSSLEHGGDMGTALYFFVIAYMLYWCFAIAIDMGASGAGAAEKMFHKGKGFVTGAVTGAAIGAGAMAYRNTGGKLMHATANNESVRGILAKAPGGGAAMKFLDYGSKGYKEKREKAIKAKTSMATRLATDERTGEVNPDIMKTYADRTGNWKIPLTQIPLSGANLAAAGKINKEVVKSKIKQGYSMELDGEDEHGIPKFKFQSAESFAAGADERVKKAKLKSVERLDRTKKELDRIEKEIKSGEKEEEVEEEGVLLDEEGKKVKRMVKKVTKLNAEEVSKRENQFDILKDRMKKIQNTLAGEEEILKVKNLDAK